MLDEQHRGVEVALDLAQARTERLGLVLREPRRRLVEQHDACAERELTGELHHAARPGRQRGGGLVGGVAEAERSEDVVGLGALASFGAR